MTGLLAVLTFLAFAVAGYAVSMGLESREARRRAFMDRLSAMTGWASGALRPSVLKDQRMSQIGVLDTLLSRLSIAQRLRRMVLQAGLRRRVGEVLLYVPLLALVGGLATTVLGGRIAFAVIVAGVASAIPFFVLARMRRKRAALFADQLPDALDLMRSALQAGHGLVGSFTIIADEFPEPIAGEFREVAEEVRLGLPMRDALHNLTERIDNPDTPLLAVGLLVAQDVGGNLTEVLDNISYTIRERFKLLREVRVLTAQGRLSGMVLTLLPFVLGGVMYAINPDYMAPLLNERQGQYILAYAIVSVTTGHFVLRRILTLKV